jgi:hypothetical protein
MKVQTHLLSVLANRLEDTRERPETQSKREQGIDEKRGFESVARQRCQLIGNPESRFDDPSVQIHLDLAVARLIGGERGVRPTLGTRPDLGIDGEEDA